MTTFTSQQQFTKVVKSINFYNDILLHPCRIVWGEMSVEEADDAFNDVNNELHDEWGVKSMNLLYYIKDDIENDV